MSEADLCEYSDLPKKTCACTHCEAGKRHDESLRDPAVGVWGGLFGG